MKATEHLTVILNTWNLQSEWLKESIKSIQPQVKRLIISYCEGDTNTELIEGLKTQYPNVDTCVLPIADQLGKCPRQSFRQINKAMLMVKTKYTSWASSGDVMLDNKYQLEMDAVTKTPQTKVAYADYTLTDDNLGSRRWIKLIPYSYQSHKTGNIVSDLAVWETSLWSEFGGFDCETFRNYSFWDFWLKIAEKYGEEAFAHVNVSTWLYRQDADSTHIKRRKSPEMQEEANRDRAAMLMSHGINP